MRCVANFRQIGSIRQTASGGYEPYQRTRERIEEVKEKMKANPKKPLRRLAQEVGMSKSTVQRIARKRLKLYPYKAQITQKIKDDDPPKRLEFAKWCMTKTLLPHMDTSL